MPPSRDDLADAEAARSLTWVDGERVDSSAGEWSARVAGFLGCGFRVVVPAGPERAGALRRAHELAARVASVVGGDLDPEPWRHLIRTSGAREVVGGWTHRFRAPAGECATRITPLPATDPAPRSASAVTLPWTVNTHSPVSGLPMVSRHGETAAARHLVERAPGSVGLWTDDGGHLVDTTAGPPLLLTAEGWTCPTATAGTVPHHLWERSADLLRASEGLVAASRAYALLCVAADGAVTTLTAVDGTSTGEGAGSHSAPVQRALAALAVLHGP